MKECFSLLSLFIPSFVMVGVFSLIADKYWVPGMGWNFGGFFGVMVVIFFYILSLSSVVWGPVIVYALGRKVSPKFLE